MPAERRTALLAADERPTDIGWVDWEVADGARRLAARRRRRGASPSSSRSSRGDEPSAYAASALRHRPRRATATPTGRARCRSKVAGLESATYSDRIMAMLGGGLGQARIGEADAADAWLRTARELADNTDDRLLAAVVRVADGPGRRAARPSRSRPTISQRRGSALEAMGITQHGWDTAFRLAAGRLRASRSRRPNVGAETGAMAPVSPRSSRRSDSRRAGYLSGCGVVRR